MPADGTITRLEADVRRDQLIRVVYKVMAREGVHRVPLSQIADEAGVSKGLLVYHFANKDSMVLAAMNWVLEATAQRIRDEISGIRPDELLHNVLDAIWIDPLANRDFFRFYLDGVEHKARSDHFSQFGQRNREIIDQLYEEIISEGQDHNVFNVSDIPVAAIQMRSVIEGTFLAWLQTDDWVDSHARYRILCEDTLRIVLGSVDN